MSKEELVQAYLAGRITRRIFIRRLIAGGVSGVAAITYARVLAPTAAGAEARRAFGPDLYECATNATKVIVTDTSVTPKAARTMLGGTVCIRNSSSQNRRITSTQSFFSTGTLHPGSTGSIVFDNPGRGSGTYPYTIDPSVGVVGTRIEVPVRLLKVTGGVRVTWCMVSPSPFVYDVQVRKPGSTTFTNWKIGQTVRRATYLRGSQPRGTYSFRARVRNPNNATQTSGYSPAVSISL